MYTNGTFTGTYNQCRDYLNASIPREHPENWPDGPWESVPYVAPELTLEQRRERQRQILKMERIERVSAPINNVQVATPEDRENVQWAASNVESADWIMADNTVQTMTAADLQAVISQYPLRKMELFGVYAGLLAQLAESNEPELIVWPE
jgi:hypothetical protein